ncbi:MAG: iron ABC transporter permease [Chloroflexi bacterium]|nr:iron ABC transporter permease [Chloroflexota bacterium]
MSLAAAARGLVRGRARQRPPPVVWVPALLVALGMLLLLAYLVARTLGAGSEALDLLLRPRTFWVAARTVALAVTVTATATALAVPLAWLTVRTDLPFRRGWSLLTVLPLVIPSYVLGFVIIAAVGPRGILQQALASLWGVERLPDVYGFPGAVLALSLATYPYMLLGLRAAWWGLDPALEETSRSLGAGPWATFRRVVLPQLRPALGAGALLVALYTLHDFGAVSLLRFEALTQQIYVQYKGSFSRHLAAVLSLVLVGLAVLVVVLEARMRGRASYHRAAPGSARLPSLVHLGGWRWPALLFCGAIVGLGVAMPVGVLGFWLWQGVSAGEPVKVLWGSAWNSLSVSVLAAVASLAAAVPVAVLGVRFPGWLARWAERTTYIGFALPGIVVALALVFFGANYVPWLYQTLALLVLGYGVLFVAQAVGAVRTSLVQVNPRVEEMGRVLGSPPWRVLLTVTLPLVRPGLLAGAALVFLTTMKELPATLLLSPIGFHTLATKVWSATEDALFARAAAPAILLVLVASLPLLWLLRQERQVRP